MSMRWPQRVAAPVALAAWLFSVLGAQPADTIMLKAGGAVHGKVVASGNSKTVAVKTSTGTLIVFDRPDVKNVIRGGNPQQKTAVGRAAAKAQLTPEEKAWLPKVRSLVERAGGADRDQSRRARAALLKIDDDNAIPALSRYLAGDRREESRLSYSTILRYIPGSRAVYCLVEQSLFDSSANVRDAARKAIGGERADLARPLFINALKAGNPNFSSLAARGIAEIGDPNGDSIPYLINALCFQTVHVVATSPATRNLDQGALDAIQLQNELNAQNQIAQSTPSASQPTRTLVKVTVSESTPPIGGNVLGNSNMSQFPFAGPMFPPIYGAKNPSSPRTPDSTTPVTMQDLMNTPVRYSTGLARENNVNPAVHDTLVQLTGQQFGNNQGNWRRWWANQVKNRALQKSQAGDRPISNSSDSPDAARSQK